MDCDIKADNEYRNGYITVYDNESISYQQFVQHHLLKNQPCIIKNIVHNKNNKNWYIYDKWLKHNDDNKCEFNYEYMNNTYGNAKIDVAYCGNKSYSDQKRTSMQLKQYIEHIKQNKEQKDNTEHTQYLNKWLHNIKQFKCSKFNPKWTSNILYCKDWHIVRDLKTNVSIYETPFLFSDDWLNYYWTKRGTNDYKFCYLGPLFSWTPLHHDVYASYSWSANIIGKKLWILFNPKESKHYLRNRKRNEWIYNILSLVDNEQALNEFKQSEYPYLKQLFEQNNQMICKRMIIQNENEAIFIPSMWFHEVYNLSDIVLSINHNWFNGMNIHWIWNCIYTEYQNVCQSIDDLKDILDDNAFYGKCQELLMDFLGINFDQFIEIISLNVDNILKMLTNNDMEQNIKNFKMKTYLFSMKNVLNTIQKCFQTKCMNKMHIKQLNDIKVTIEDTLSHLKFLTIDDTLWKASDIDIV